MSSSSNYVKVNTVEINQIFHIVIIITYRRYRKKVRSRLLFVEFETYWLPSSQHYNAKSRAYGKEIESVASDRRIANKHGDIRVFE